VTPLRQGQATRAAILDATRSGQYDCIHYAGHAFFDESSPGRSGLLCAHDEVLAGLDLRGIGNLPYFVLLQRLREGPHPRRRPVCGSAEVRHGGRLECVRHCRVSHARWNRQLSQHVLPAQQ
jgi:hypothetical protein